MAVGAVVAGAAQTTQPDPFQSEASSSDAPQHLHLPARCETAHHWCVRLGNRKNGITLPPQTQADFSTGMNKLDLPHRSMQEIQRVRLGGRLNFGCNSLFAAADLVLRNLRSISTGSVAAAD